MIGIGVGAYRIHLCFYLDHAHEIGTVVVVIAQLGHELLLRVCLQDELVERADHVLVAQFVVEELQLAEVVDGYAALGLEAGVAAAAGQLRRTH